jgi:hypothetical protein
MTKCFCVDASDQFVTGEHYASPLEREILG